MLYISFIWQKVKQSINAPGPPVNSFIHKLMHSSMFSLFPEVEADILCRFGEPEPSDAETIASESDSEDVSDTELGTESQDPSDPGTSTDTTGGLKGEDPKHCDIRDDSDNVVEGDVSSCCDSDSSCIITAADGFNDGVCLLEEEDTEPINKGKLPESSYQRLGLQECAEDSEKVCSQTFVVSSVVGSAPECPLVMSSHQPGNLRHPSSGAFPDRLSPGSTVAHIKSQECEQQEPETKAGTSPKRRTSLFDKLNKPSTSVKLDATPTSSHVRTHDLRHPSDNSSGHTLVEGKCTTNCPSEPDSAVAGLEEYKTPPMSPKYLDRIPRLTPDKTRHFLVSPLAKPLGGHTAMLTQINRDSRMQPRSSPSSSEIRQILERLKVQSEGSVKSPLPRPKSNWQTPSQSIPAKLVRSVDVNGDHVRSWGDQAPRLFQPGPSQDRHKVWPVKPTRIPTNVSRLSTEDTAENSRNVSQCINSSGTSYTFQPRSSSMASWDHGRSGQCHKEANLDIHSHSIEVTDCMLGEKFKSPYHKPVTNTHQSPSPSVFKMPSTPLSAQSNSSPAFRSHRDKPYDSPSLQRGWASTPDLNKIKATPESRKVSTTPVAKTQSNVSTPTRKDQEIRSSATPKSSEMHQIFEHLKIKSTEKARLGLSISTATAQTPTSDSRSSQCVQTDKWDAKIGYVPLFKSRLGKGRRSRRKLLDDSSSGVQMAETDCSQSSALGCGMGRSSIQESPHKEGVVASCTGGAVNQSQLQVSQGVRSDCVKVLQTGDGSSLTHTDSAVLGDVDTSTISTHLGEDSADLADVDTISSDNARLDSTLCAESNKVSPLLNFDLVEDHTVMLNQPGVHSDQLYGNVARTMRTEQWVLDQNMNRVKGHVPLLEGMSERGVEQEGAKDVMKGNFKLQPTVFKSVSEENSHGSDEKPASTVSKKEHTSPLIRRGSPSTIFRKMKLQTAKETESSACKPPPEPRVGSNSPQQFTSTECQRHPSVTHRSVGHDVSDTKACNMVQTDGIHGSMSVEVKRKSQHGALPAEAHPDKPDKSRGIHSSSSTPVKGPHQALDISCVSAIEPASAVCVKSKAKADASQVRKQLLPGVPGGEKTTIAVNQLLPSREKNIMIPVNSHGRSHPAVQKQTISSQKGKNGKSQTTHTANTLFLGIRETEKEQVRKASPPRHQSHKDREETTPKTSGIAMGTRSRKVLARRRMERQSCEENIPHTATVPQHNLTSRRDDVMKDTGHGLSTHRTKPGDSKRQEHQPGRLSNATGKYSNKLEWKHRDRMPLTGGNTSHVHTRSHKRCRSESSDSDREKSSSSKDFTGQQKLQRLDDGDSDGHLSFNSSVCLGPGKCQRTFCFTCAV